MNRICSLAIILMLGAVSLAAQDMAVSHAPSGVTTAPATPSVRNPGLPAELKRAVVTVNGAVITERDVQEQMPRLFPYYSMHGGKVPDKYYPEIREKAIQQLITDELEYQEAKRLGITVAPAIQQSVIRQARERFQTRAAYEEFGKEQYGSVQEFEKRIRRATVIATFQHREVELKSKVTDAQVRQIYEKNKKAFLRPESVLLQSISINLPEKPSDEQKKMARKRIEEILPQAKAAKNYEEFGTLAEKVSEDDYHVMMGDHKWVHLVGLPPVMSQALASLKPGEVSGIVELPGGYTILRVNERRSQKQMEFSEVRDKLREQLQTEARQHRQETLEQRLRKSAKIEIVDKVG
jgi:parvulin-like peptidyl-prolyl isomerase